MSLLCPRCEREHEGPCLLLSRRAFSFGGLGLVAAAALPLPALPPLDYVRLHGELGVWQGLRIYDKGGGAGAIECLEELSPRTAPLWWVSSPPKPFHVLILREATHGSDLLEV